MDFMHIVLALLALVAAGSAIWGFRVALAARERAAGAEASLQSATAAEEASRAALDAARAESNEQARRATALHEQLTAQKVQSQRDLDAQERVFLEREKALLRERESFEHSTRQMLDDMRAKFQALAGEALKDNHASFLRLAAERLSTEHQKGANELDQRRTAFEQLVAPIRDTLRKTEERLGAFSMSWAEDKAALGTRLEAASRDGQRLAEETGRLVKALSKPEIRGRYGEIQLRRVAELAGMTAYCDFTEQTTGANDAGQRLRPDLIVRLPNERVVPVDAKTNTHAYIEAVSATTDEERAGHLARFARHVREQIDKLSRKEYWNLDEGSTPFVVMFIPGDQFLDAALARDPELLEFAASKNVVIASPSTLIGLLRAVHVGWREATVAAQARELFALGKELHERAAVFLGHFAKVGESLATAIKRYNDAVGSVETRLLPSLRKFDEAGAGSGKSLPEAAFIEARPRELDAPEPA